MKHLTIDDEFGLRLSFPGHILRPDPIDGRIGWTGVVYCQSVMMGSLTRINYSLGRFHTHAIFEPVKNKNYSSRLNTWDVEIQKLSDVHGSRANSNSKGSFPTILHPVPVFQIRLHRNYKNLPPGSPGLRAAQGSLVSPLSLKLLGNSFKNKTKSCDNE